MTWIDVVLVAVFAAAVLGLLAGLGIIDRRWALAGWAAIVSAMALIKRAIPTKDDVEQDPEPEVDYGQDDADEDLDLGKPDHGDDFLLDLHERGSDSDV